MSKTIRGIVFQSRFGLQVVTQLTITLLLTLSIYLLFDSRAKTVLSQGDEFTSLIPVTLKPTLEPICGEVERFSGTLTTNTTLDPSKTYIINGDITIRPNVTLTILPGTVLKFEYDRGIHVEGKLVAQGTSSNPIYFSSYRNDYLCGDTNNDGTATVATRGDWRWIQFAEGSHPDSVVEHAIVEYGGQDEVPGNNHLRAPIRLVNVVPTLDYITFRHNIWNAAQLVGGNWTSQALTSTTVIFWIYDGDLTVLPRNTLIVDPGVRIKVAYDHGIYVRGLLSMQGTEQRPITVTSDEDDSVCGLGAGNETVCDTNDDGNASIAVTGDWRWIEFDEESDPTSSIRHTIIRYGGQDEIPGDNNWRAPIRMFNVVPNLDYITLEHNFRNAAQLIGGDWTSHVLSSTTVIYWVYDRGDIVVLPRNTFTIEPEVNLKIGYDHGIYIEGVLHAKGNQAHPITITSEHDDSVCGVGADGEDICDTNNNGVATIPTMGDWRWIEFVETDDLGSTIEYAVVRYGGQNEVPGNNHWRAPIRMFNISPTLNNITLEYNFRNAVQLIGGNWTSKTLSSTTVIYWLYDGGDLVVLPRNMLTIDPGAKIKVGYDHGINAQGILHAVGTETQPIVITSDQDDTVCGLGAANELICDTNNDMIATVPTMGGWRWISFPADSDAGSMISHAVIRYGGQNEVPGNNQWRAAVLVDDASPTISRVDFDNNHRAIDFFNNASPSLECNDVKLNEDTSWYTFTGMYNHNPANGIVAEGHWWSESSGPTHPSNPSGTGLVVSDGIDFTPWLTSPCTDFDLDP